MNTRYPIARKTQRLMRSSNTVRVDGDQTKISKSISVVIQTHHATIATGCRSRCRGLGGHHFMEPTAAN